MYAVFIPHVLNENDVVAIFRLTAVKAHGLGNGGPGGCLPSSPRLGGFFANIIAVATVSRAIKVDRY